MECWLMAEIYSLYFGETSGDLDLVAANIDGVTYAVPGVPLEYGTTYYWRVDATNEYGTTQGDEWSFATLAFDPPHSTYRYRSNGSLVLDGTTYNAATMYASGENFLSVSRRLVAAAANAIFYEQVDT
jgi:hypothetical protein